MCLLDAQVGMSGEEQHAANGSGEGKENVASHSALYVSRFYYLFLLTTFLS